MLLHLGELSEEMGKIFMREYMKTAKQITCKKGEIIFRKGDSTHHFYTLVQGELRLTIGDNDQHVYTVSHPGESFGWSSLVGGNTYTATAFCTELSEVLKFDRDRLVELLEQNSAWGYLFFKKIAEMLGKRLLESYRIIEHKVP